MNLLKTALISSTLFILALLPQSALAICLPTTIQTSTNQTVVNTCPGDGEEDKVKFKPSSFATAYRWLVTDTNDVIIDWFFGSIYDFEPLGEGINRVWGISYSGSIDIPIGENIFTADYDVNCHIISDNFVLVNRVIPDAGEVLLNNGTTTAYVCPNDGQANVLNFVNVDAKPGNYAYIITDVNGIIVGLAPDGEFDFEPMPTGICQVYGVNYVGNLIAQIGDDIALDDVADSCFEISDSFITVVKDNPVGSAVSLDDDLNSIEAELCSNDDNANILSFTNISTSLAQYTYLITDENNVLLGIVQNGSHDFEGVPQGICRVYGLSFTGNISALASLDIFAQTLSTDCWEVSVNYVTVVRHEMGGGEVSLSDDALIFTLCPDNGIPDTAFFKNTSLSTANYAYLITDTVGNILAISTDNFFDFDGAGEGVCRVYGLSYWEEISANVGENIQDNALATECYEVSENFITVIREIPDAAEIALNGGGLTAYTCPDDGVADEVSFSNTSLTISDYAYFITDDNNHILTVSTTGTQDFDGAGVGICRVYGVAFTGNLNWNMGDSLQAIAVSDDCYDISENYVEVIRENPVGGEVFLANGDELKVTCSGDGVSDSLSFQNVGASNSKYAYIITDIDNFVVGITDEYYDFEPGDLGFYFVFGVAYTGNITVQIGDDIGEVDISDDCYDFSTNLVLVIKTIPEGGEISLLDGSTEATVCSGDDAEDILTLNSTTTSEADYIFAITDENNVILDIDSDGIIDFEGVPAGICRIYGISYTGNLITAAGDLVLEDALSDDCFEVSENYVTVTRSFVDGGEVSSFGETVVYTCPFDGLENIIQFQTSSTANNANYSYVLTNNSNILVEIPSDDAFDFEALGIGISRVYGISHVGDLTVAIGDDITTTLLSDGCYNLSDNFLEIIRDIPIGDQIVSDAGDVVNLCVNDGNPDVVNFITGSFSFAQYAWVLTDENDIIEAISLSSDIDFDETNPGNCRVYGLSYTGNIIATPGDPIEGLLTDDCYDVSNNFIEINRTGVDGSTIFLPNGNDVAYVCPGDGSPDFIGFFNNSDLPNTEYRYVITDTNNVVFAIIPFNLFDFDNFEEGICRVWGISHTGELELDDEDILTEVAISDECYELSENFITIIKEIPDLGEITTEGGFTNIIVEIDGIQDSVFFEIATPSLANFSYIMTDENDIIIDIFEENVYDFTNSNGGICRVYGIAYTGNLTAQIGENLNEIDPATGCWDLTDNFVMLNKVELGDNFNGNTNPNISISSEQFSDLKIYPNPVSDLLNIQIKSDEFETGELLISNTNGQIIFQQNLENDQIRIDVSNWYSGYYFVRWKGSRGVFEGRILVNH